MADINRAKIFQKLATEIFFILISGRLVKPKMSNVMFSQFGIRNLVMIIDCKKLLAWQKR